ncbi:MAG: glycogen debranching enzyme N-terminal domain-containing protein [Lentisphaeria bacterium]|nr:glycogen debranching enzyme N-terminal domain-containing protein [Lentisphaeria bacterium]
MTLRQTILPGQVQFFTGETVTFRLSGVTENVRGKAILRTNIGGGAAKIDEQLEKSLFNRTPKGSDWHDLDMHAAGAGVYQLTLPLTEVGIFEAKCCFLPADGSPARWPQGGNFVLKVSGNANVDSNGIYCCFVRQFGQWMYLPHSPQLPDFSVLDAGGFTVVPPSGTFRNVIKQLDHIFDTLNCRILQLLPIHPTPMAYGKMGRYGSPFAAMDYFAVDPALADFDTKASPMEQFIELIDAVHARGGRIFMDMPVNHTGWSSKLQNEHPDYFLRKDDGEFISPGAWGVTWADLCQLDYRKKAVYELMAKVFLFWCRKKVDGFRCDAGYMVPPEAWEYILAKVRREFPETTFLLEGLGGPIPVQKKLLEKTGLDWGYSELFQNYNRDDICNYYPGMTESVKNGGILVNFAETHDNQRLAAGGNKIYAKLRFLVNALLSVNGTFGFANGAEFFAEEKIDVHQCGALNFAAVDNLCPLIGRLNSILALHPAFSRDAEVKLIQHGPGNVIAALRTGENIPELLILLNLDCSNSSGVYFPSMPYPRGTDLLTGREVFLQDLPDGQQTVTLAAGEGLCLSFEPFAIPEKLPLRTGKREKLMAAAMAQKAALNFTTLSRAADADGNAMLADPEKFAGQLSGIFPPPVTHWYYPRDSHREVMAAPGDLLLIHCEEPFAIQLTDDRSVICRQESLRRNNGQYFSLLPLPRCRKKEPEYCTLDITVYSTDGIKKSSGKIMLLPESDKRMVKLSGKWNEAANCAVFGSNSNSSYAMFSAQWGTLTGKYDAILAVNGAKGYPADRYVMFTRCRAWLMVDGYSRELTARSLENFSAHPGNRAKWEFLMPDGRGGRCRLTVEFRMASDRDMIEFKFRRELRPDGVYPEAQLIIRPDLEDRVNHSVTRAYDGPEHLFPAAVTTFSNGFNFQPEKRNLNMQTSAGTFHYEPQWYYQADLPQERYYGMADKTDLFSPGYFAVMLVPGENVTLTASAENDLSLPATMPPAEFPEVCSPGDLAVDALERFVVHRDGLSTIIAGYPWFMDWGRDTLIVLRGLVAFPEFQQRSSEIIRRFAAFEKSGTIPNMICGGNDSNRDTSDAPLYLILAVRDYIAATGDRDFLRTDCGGRTLDTILHSIIHHYRHGTPNGIVMDQDSALIFSPSHFSWMDTNYPAGTPREGYPVEIQSLWFAALTFLGENELAQKVKNSIEKFYFSGDHIADCLHAVPGTPANRATPDDHLRCNILTAVTCGAVSDPAKQQQIIDAAGKLLIPGAIRTLDDAGVKYALPVRHNGNLLNDPSHPYRGYYNGPEDTSRKVAYHNGTAWCWPFPAYCEALAIAGGAKSRKRALALLLSAIRWMEQGVIGELPEVLDGDMPHRNGGCLAQAWSVSEFYRVLKLLKRS